MNKYVKKSFLKKDDGWSYEKEWRIIRNTQSNYLHFDSKDLKGIIFGHKLNKEILNFITANMNLNIIKMKTNIGYRSFRINILPINYELDLDGSLIKVLDVEKTLEKGKYKYTD